MPDHFTWANTSVYKGSIIHLNQRILALSLALGLAVVFVGTASAGQGVVRMLYTVPNSPFIENPTGDSVVTINDSSGSVATLQALINNARSASSNAIIVVHLLSGATYSVSSAGLTLSSGECLVGTGAIIKATNSSVTVPLITITSGAANVSVAGGTLDGNGANIYGIFAPGPSARVNVDKVTVRNCGQDCIQLNGNGDTTFDNEMTVTRCDASGSPGHSGISIWNATQTVCVDNNCHNNAEGIWMGNCAYATIANNTCESNSVGIDFNSGNNDNIANNTCNANGTGILADGSSTMIVSDSIGSNTVAGINSSGSGNIYADNLFTPGNATNFMSGGSGNLVVAYKGVINAASENYFYPPLINDQHNNTIVNGMGRTDLTISSTTIDSVQSQYTAAMGANPNNVIVLHLNGTFVVGANPLTLSSNTCVLLNGTIQINSSTGATAAIAGTNLTHVSISGGTIDGGGLTGNNGVHFSGAVMSQVDAVTLQNFGPDNPRVGGSDVIHFDHGATPTIITRCTINGGAARGIWLETGGPRSIVSDNQVTAVNEDGVDCDASTSGSLVKFNYCHDLVRYGVFLEQSASYNLALGNICNNDGRDINVYNNSATPRGDTAFNSVVCNSLMGNNGLRNGSTGTNVVQTSHNFFFNNTVINADIESQLYGTENYYSQNFLSGGALSTAGVELFFNSPDVSGNLQVQDSNSGLDAVVQNAATTNGAPVVTGTANGRGNDEWQLIPTDSGYYRLMNENSGLAMVVLNASTNNGAGIVQWAYDASGNDEWMPRPSGNGLYNFVNRLSGLYLDVTGANTNAGTHLDQQPSSGGANQQFALIDAAAPGSIAAGLNTVTWTSGGAPDGNWETAANWGGVLPQAGDWLQFGSGTQVLTTNNFAGGTVLDNVAFGGGSPSFTLNGNGIMLANSLEDVNGTNSAGSIINASINTETINLPVTLSAGNHVITTGGGAGQLNFGGILGRNSGALAQFDIGGGAIDTSLANVNSIVGGWAVVSTTGTLVNNNGGAGTVNWAATSSGAITPLSSYTSISGSGVSIPNETGNNVKITSDGTAADTLSTAGVTDMNTLYFAATGTNGQVNIGSGQTLRLGAEGGILANSPRYCTIGSGGSGTLTASGGTSGPGELSLYNLSYYSGGGLVINAVIKDNGVGNPVALNTLGSVNVNFPNSYSGGTYVNEGELYLQGGASLGTGPVYVFPGGRADYGGNNGATVTNSFYLEGFGFVVGGEPGAIKGVYNGTLTGGITLLGDAAIDPNAGSGTNTCNFTGPVGGTGSLIIAGANANYVAGTATFSGTNSYTGDAIIDASANQNGGAGIRIAAGKNNIMQNGGDMVLIGGTSGVATFDLNGTTQQINELVATNGTAANAIVKSSAGSGTLVVGGDGGDSTFGGRIQNGGGSVALIKVGGGTLTLTGNNSHSGATTVSGGTLALSGTGSISNTVTITVAAGATLDASGRADQTVNLVSGQTLLGSGAVNVNLNAGSGATVMPGNSTNIGPLSVAGEAQLQGTTIMKVNAAAGTADQINASGFAYGGTLTVTNISGIFVAGQAFELFLGDSYSGSFTVTNLPPLNPGLRWINNLATSGALQVASAVKAAPGITGIVLSGTNLILSGTNGVGGEVYVLLGSTNAALPLKQWVPMQTNSFSGGNFSVTNSIDPNAPQSFYILQLP